MFECLESRIALSASADNDPLAPPPNVVAPLVATIHPTAAAGPAVITSLASLARSADRITIRGTGFDLRPGRNTVSFDGGATGHVVSATRTQLVVQFRQKPAAAGTLSASVTANGRSSGTPVAVATVVQPPRVTADPSSLSRTAATLTIRGSGFDPTNLTNRVSLSGGTTGRVTAATTTTLTVAVSGLPRAGATLSAAVTSFGRSSGKRVPVATVTTPNRDELVSTRATVPDPVDIRFRVQFHNQQPLTLVGHYWYNKPAVDAGRQLPAIVEINPYRRRDGTIAVDSRMYPYFASQGYLCFRVDLPGSGDSEGVLTDEYTEEELAYCVQVIEQISTLPMCDGNVGMMGESWSALNSLMVASRADCPAALKAIIVNCGSDDRYNDDVHYMGGAMMMDNGGWASSMWGWLSQPPDPSVVGADRWQSMWKQRLDNADFWFGPWARHQTRDTYWSTTSVRNDFSTVKVPVLVMSGWEDGYKNPVETVVSGLTQAGKPVSGLIGPWGHKYPNTASPGPRIDWLPYATSHWWDKYLKGVEPDPHTALPQMTVWLGESREPGSATDFTDRGKWVAEDANWPGRARQSTLYLSNGNRLSSAPPAQSSSVTGSSGLVFATNMLETSSFGTAGNNDLAGDQDAADKQSLYFDSAPLQSDVDCFGKPVVNLTLSCDQPIASIAVRLCEISPVTGQSHLVSYSFFNLAQRNGDQATPTPVTPGEAFTVPIPLNLIGHTFKAGWKLRLAVSPSFFPTLWQSAKAATLTVYTGTQGALPASEVTLPVRPARTEDASMKDLLPADQPVISVDTSTYARAVTLREARFTRVVTPLASGQQSGVTVSKTMDSGRYRYAAHGPLKGLIVDQVLRENFQMLDGDPLSYKCFTSSQTSLRRSLPFFAKKYGWGARSETSTDITSIQNQQGVFFHYTATIHTFVTGVNGRERPFVSRTVSGDIPRTWV